MFLACIVVDVALVSATDVGTAVVVAFNATSIDVAVIFLSFPVVLVIVACMCGCLALVLPS